MTNESVAKLFAEQHCLQRVIWLYNCHIFSLISLYFIVGTNVSVIYLISKRKHIINLLIIDHQSLWLNCNYYQSYYSIKNTNPYYIKLIFDFYFFLFFCTIVNLQWTLPDTFYRLEICFLFHILIKKN